MKRIAHRIAAISAASLLALSGAALAEGEEKPDAPKRGDVSAGNPDTPEWQGETEKGENPATRRGEHGEPDRTHEGEKDQDASKSE